MEYATYSRSNISFQGISELLGYKKGWLRTRLTRKSKWLEELKQMGFSGRELEYIVPHKLRGASTAKTLTQQDFILLLTYEACKGNPRAACAISGVKVVSKANSKRKDESKVRDSLAKKLNGQVEVSTPVGRIDILTEEEIIEVKNWNSWKCGLGQILVYGTYYPEKLKRIHCFGKPASDICLIESHLALHKVFLSFEV